MSRRQITLPYRFLIPFSELDLLHLLLVSVDDAAGLLGKDPSAFTPSSFQDIYEQVWLINPGHDATATLLDSNSTETEDVSDNGDAGETEDDEDKSTQDSGAIADTDSMSSGCKISTLMGMSLVFFIVLFV